MRDFFVHLKKPVKNQRGVTNMMTLMLILPSFLCITVMVILFVTFLMRQAKIDDIKERALQMVETEGYLSTVIIDDTKNKLAQLGFPSVAKNGITYPTFDGSTMTKVLKDDPEPSVRLVIQYPATDLARLMAFLGVSRSEDPGFFYLEGYGRSEKYE